MTCKMKKSILIILSLAFGFISQGQTDSTKTQTVSISKGLEVFVFPKNNQTKEQQEMDEYMCYKWAVEQTGYNPINPPEVKPDTVQTGPDGSAVRGAARGAAAGAAIGAIAGDAGDGAAIGAVAGALRGRRARAYKQQQQQAANNKAAADANAKMLADFKKAFMVCMEAKEYQVK